MTVCREIAKPRQGLVHDCCRFMKGRLGHQVNLEDLCHLVAVSPRTLEYAFKEVLGTSPISWYRTLRFAAARHTLLFAEPRKTSVTEVATRFSFWHLGRFSGEYRTRFGESPSITLQRGRRSPCNGAVD